MLIAFFSHFSTKKTMDEMRNKLALHLEQAEALCEKMTKYTMTDENNRVVVKNDQAKLQRNLRIFAINFLKEKSFTMSTIYAQLDQTGRWTQLSQSLSSFAHSPDNRSLNPLQYPARTILVFFSLLFSLIQVSCRALTYFIKFDFCKICFFFFNLWIFMHFISSENKNKFENSF